jgi:FMN reductase [NAD(P)H]
MTYPKDVFSRMFGGASRSDNGLLYPKVEEEEEEEVNVQELDDALQTNIFNVMLNRRSQRKFENREVSRFQVYLFLLLIS